MAEGLGSDPAVFNVEDLAEYQRLKNEHYIPFNFGSEGPAQNHFYSDKDVYPEWPALFSTQGTRYHKRAAPGKIDWASLKDRLIFDDHPHAVKVIAARFRKDFPLECKAIDESSWERLPYYFDDLDLYHWSPKFLRSVIQCIYEEKSMLHANILRFAIHLIATDAPRARQIAYFGRAVWYHEEVAHYGVDFLEEVIKFMTHRGDVIQLLTECANKYLEEARGDSHMRPMYYDEVFKKLTEARTMRLCHSAFKGPVLMYNVPPPLAPNVAAHPAKNDTENATIAQMTFLAREQEHGKVPSPARSGKKFRHHRRTSSLGNGDIATAYQAKIDPVAEVESLHSAVERTSASFNADFGSAGQTLAEELVGQKAVKKPDASTSNAASTYNGDRANSSSVEEDMKSGETTSRLAGEASSTALSDTCKTDKDNHYSEFSAETTRRLDSEMAKSDIKEAGGLSLVESKNPDDQILAGRAMDSMSGNQKALSQKRQTKHPVQKQLNSKQSEGKTSGGGTENAVVNLKRDNNSTSQTVAEYTRGAETQGSGSFTAKASKGKKKNNSNKRKGSGLRNEARSSGSPAPLPETSFDHTRKISTSRSIFDEDNSVISVTVEGEKRFSPNRSPEAPEPARTNVHPYGFSQDYRNYSGSSGGDYQPRTIPWTEPQLQPTEHVYAHEPSMSSSQPWQHDPTDPAFQVPPVHYITAQNSGMSYGAEYQTQWAPFHPQPSVHAVGPFGQVTGGHFYGSAPPFTNQGYHQQLCDPQSGSSQQHNHVFQHYQHEPHYNQRENRKRYPENSRYNYDKFPNRHWNTYRGHRRDYTQNTGSVRGSSFDRSIHRTFQPGYNSSDFDNYNGSGTQNTHEQTYQTNDENRSLTTSEDPVVSLPTKSPENAIAEMMTDSGATTIIQYPIMYPAIPAVHNTPVVSRDMSTSASPKDLQNKAICNVDLNAVNAELQVQSRAISYSEGHEKDSCRPENVPAALEIESDAASDTMQSVSGNAHDHTGISGKETTDSIVCSTSTTNIPEAKDSKAAKRTLVPDPAQQEEDAQFPSLKFAASQTKSKHHSHRSVQTHKPKEASKPVPAKQEQISVVHQSQSVQASQTGPSTQPGSPKMKTTVITTHPGRRSPSLRLPQHDMRFPQRNAVNREDPYKLYVSGSGLNDIILARIFEPFQPEFITTTRATKTYWQYSNANAPLNLRYAFVTFDSTDKCNEVKQALSGAIREGISLKVSSALMQYDNFGEVKASRTANRSVDQHVDTRRPSNPVTVPAQESQLRRTNIDDDVKHDRSFSTSSGKTKASGNHSTMGDAGAGTKSMKAARKKGLIPANKPATNVSQTMVQVPDLSEVVNKDSNQTVATKPSDNNEQNSTASSKQAKATVTPNPQIVKTELQSVIISENNQAEDKYPVINDSSTPSSVTADHPPVASRVKKSNIRNSKKKKRQSKDIDAGSNRNAPLSSASLEFPVNLDDSEASSPTTHVKDNSGPTNRDEAEMETTAQGVAQPPSIGQEPDAMIWEPTGSQSEHKKVENHSGVENQADQGFTKAIETETSDSSNFHPSQGIADAAINETQDLDLDLSVVLSDTSDETVGREKGPQSTRIIITYPRDDSLHSSSSTHGMPWLDSEELVSFGRLVNDGEGIERMVDQYRKHCHSSLPIDTDQGLCESVSKTEQAQRIGSALSTPALVYFALGDSTLTACQTADPLSAQDPDNASSGTQEQSLSNDSGYPSSDSTVRRVSMIGSSHSSEADAIDAPIGSDISDDKTAGA